MSSGDAKGGGVYIDAEEAIISDCVIRGNRCVGKYADFEFSGQASGGGIYYVSAVDPAPQLVFNTTIAGNRVTGDGGALGGGIYVFMDPIPRGAAVPVSAFRLFQCTLSGNGCTQNETDPRAAGRAKGGGIYFLGITRSTLLDFCTITENEAADGGAGIGIFRNEIVDLYHTIASGNLGEDISPAAPVGQDDGANSPVRGSILSLGYNIFGTGPVLADFSATGDQTGVLDPALAPLGKNGGNVPTHNVLTLSPAFQKGSANPTIEPWILRGFDYLADAVCNDTRGFPYLRTYNLLSDIGALEWHPKDYLPPGILKLTRRVDGTVLIDARVRQGKTYFLEYSDDMREFARSQIAIPTTGETSRFIDAGFPLTNPPPTGLRRRYYRIVEE